MNLLSKLVRPGSSPSSSTTKTGASPETQSLSRSRSIVVNWVLPRKLAVGSLPRSGHETVLAELGIRSILTLCAPAEGTLPTEIQKSFPCQQFFLPDSHYVQPIEVEQLAEAARIVSRLIQRRSPVYVHCLAGQERSALTCLTYLCCYLELDMMGALAYLKQVHPPASPTNSQLLVLQTLLERERQARKPVGTI